MQHITVEQRYIISVLLQEKKPKKELAKIIGKDKSTIYREIKRNKDLRNDKYLADLAQRKYQKRCKEKPKKRYFTEEMPNKIDEFLCQKQYSPEQISGYCKQNQINMVSHERIYQYIWEDKKNKGNLHKNLRRQGRKYQKRGDEKSSRGQISNRKDLELRPKIVDEKTRFGDLEIDTIIGQNHQSAIMTINDRCSGFVWIEKLKCRKAEELFEAAVQKLLPWKKWIKTITSDNGKEFAMHEKIAEQLGMDFYFAKPYASHQKGANENLNGLIRQYFPKKTDLSQIPIQEIKRVQALLNNRPRKRFEDKNPVQMLENLLNTKVAFVT